MNKELVNGGITCTGIILNLSPNAEPCMSVAIVVWSIFLQHKEIVPLVSFKNCEHFINKCYWFISTVVNGYLELSFELGSGPAEIRASTKKVNDGARHTAVIKRQASDGSLELDKDITEFGESPGGLTQLNTKGSIYLGMEKNKSFKFNDLGRICYSVNL